MHGLNSLYYPDHQPLSSANELLLRDYYTLDVLMLGYTHGRNVLNTALENFIPGCITRTYAAPAKKALVVQMLSVANERKWTVDTPLAAPRKNLEVMLDLPGGIAPQSVLFASPDVPTLQKPVKLSFDIVSGKLRTTLPQLRVYGTLILRY